MKSPLHSHVSVSCFVSFLVTMAAVSIGTNADTINGDLSVSGDGLFGTNTSRARLNLKDSEGQVLFLEGPQDYQTTGIGTSVDVISGAYGSGLRIQTGWPDSFLNIGQEFWGAVGVGGGTLAIGNFQEGRGAQVSLGSYWPYAWQPASSITFVNKTAGAGSKQAFAAIVAFTEDDQLNAGGLWLCTNPASNTINSYPHAALQIRANRDVTIYGVDNRLPSQTITGPSSIMTRGLADARYIPISSWGTGEGFVNIGSPFYGAAGMGGATVAIASWNAERGAQLSLGANWEHHTSGNGEMARMSFINKTAEEADKRAYAEVVGYTEDSIREAGGLRFTTNLNPTQGYPTTKMQISANGDVGIGTGTAAPGARLAVNGAVKISGALSANGGIQTPPGQAAIFRGLVLIAPQGDVEMGAFQNGPQP